MPCQSDEEFTQGSEKPNPVTPTKQQCNAGACHDNQDAKNLNVCTIQMSHSIGKRGGGLINRIHNYIMLASLPMIMLKIILLNFTTMVFLLLKKSSDICIRTVRFPIYLIACLRVGINISEERNSWSFLEFLAYT
jgi:hypothetical protein